MLKRIRRRALRKVLCSIGAGPHAELLAISGETFRMYAERHGYSLELRTELAPSERPASWSKVVLIQELLRAFDIVVWVDADAAIVEPSRDIADELRRGADFGVVAHEYDGQVIPNCGVMVVRAGSRSRRFLGQVWEQTQFISHKWWENAAILELLGYQLEPTVVLTHPAPMLRRFQFLDRSWNSVMVDESPHPRINHYPGRSQEYRLEHLRTDLELARSRLPARDRRD